MLLLEGLATVLNFFGYNVIFISYLSGFGIIPLLLMLLTSLIFGYCIYHRIPLYYIMLNNLLILYDCYIGLPIGTIEYFMISMFLLVCAIICTVIIYLICKKKHKRKYEKIEFKKNLLNLNCLLKIQMSIGLILMKIQQPKIFYLLKNM